MKDGFYVNSGGNVNKVDPIVHDPNDIKKPEIKFDSKKAKKLKNKIEQKRKKIENKMDNMYEEDTENTKKSKTKDKVFVNYSGNIVEADSLERLLEDEE